MESERKWKMTTTHGVSFWSDENVPELVAMVYNFEKY
jgi:hypothetical protein